MLHKKTTVGEPFLPCNEWKRQTFMPCQILCGKKNEKNNESLTHSTDTKLTRLDLCMDLIDKDYKKIHIIMNWFYIVKLEIQYHILLVLYVIPSWKFFFFISSNFFRQFRRWEHRWHRKISRIELNRRACISFSDLFFVSYGLEMQYVGNKDQL